MRCRRLIIPIFFFLFFFASCGEDEEPYPSILTELADVETDENGVLRRFTTDEGKSMSIANYLDGYQPRAVYRCVCGYVVEDGEALLYQLSGVHILRDSTECAVQDPVALVSVWRAGHYVNMQLSPKTQGGSQYWGFSTDSLMGKTAFLSLHHRQNGDPLAYSTTVYASLPVDSIRCDSISLSIRTFGGIKTFRFKR